MPPAGRLFSVLASTPRRAVYLSVAAIAIIAAVVSVFLSGNLLPALHPYNIMTRMGGPQSYSSAIHREYYLLTLRIDDLYRNISLSPQEDQSSFASMFCFRLRDVNADTIKLVAADIIHDAPHLDHLLRCRPLFETAFPLNVLLCEVSHQLGRDYPNGWPADQTTHPILRQIATHSVMDYSPDPSLGMPDDNPSLVAAVMGWGSQNSCFTWCDH